jgi:hypothetical protein
MRKFLMAATAAAALVIMPGVASADPDAAGGAAAGAAVGAGTGFLIGGPIGAAVGAGVGGTVGAGAASSPRHREEVVIEREGRERVRERDCVRDSFGNVTCTEVRR